MYLSSVYFGEETMCEQRLTLLAVFRIRNHDAKENKIR